MRACAQMLATLSRWVDEVPPQPGSRCVTATLHTGKALLADAMQFSLPDLTVCMLD